MRDPRCFVVLHVALHVVGGEECGAGGGASGSGSSTDPMETQTNLMDRFEGLNLHGKEKELDLLGEIDDLIKETRWITIFRVHT